MLAPPAPIPILPEKAGPTLADFWDGSANFVLDTQDTALPMGESDTIMPALPTQEANRTFISYVHASQQSSNVYDSCGDPVAFPGCTIIYRSHDNGQTFTVSSPDAQQPPTCLIPCKTCPCQSERDHIDQQQYPRVVTNGGRWWMVYEYRANVMLRRSTDGLNWSEAEMIPLTGIWQEWLMSCAPEERIGSHPFAAPNYDCLVGGPPGIYFEDETLYIFVALGQNPGSMGCYRGPAGGPAALFRKCDQNPLFTGADTYGHPSTSGVEANPYFDFRTISSAELIKVDGRYYMLYEGVRGPAEGDGGDTQFGLGLARSVGEQIDGEWERYAGNPLLVDQPGNVGLGHADLLVVDGQTWLFTSLDGVTRSRFVLAWR